MRLILHIGMPKTGTTAIQTALEDQRDRLRAQGILYPTGLSPRGAQFRFLLRAIAVAGAWELALPGGFRGRGPETQAELDGIDESLDRQAEGMDAMVVSSETMWNFATNGHARHALASYAARFADDVTLVAYLRRQDLHVTSGYAQYVQGNDHGRSAPKPGERRPRQYRYHDVLAEWREAFPQARFVVRPYERGQLVDGDAVADFARHTGLPIDPAPPGMRPNQTLDATSIAFLDRLNDRVPKLAAPRTLHPGRVMVRAALERRAADGVKRPRIALGRASALAFLDHYAAQNEAVARLWLGREDGVLFREPVEGPDEDVIDPLASGGEAVEEVVDLCAAIVEEAGERIAALQAETAALRRAVRATRDGAAKDMTNNTSEAAPADRPHARSTP